MSLERCIVDLEKEGKLTPDQAERAREVYGRLRRHHERSMGPVSAEALASADAVAAIERDALLAKRDALLQVAAQKRIIADMASFKGKSRGRAAAALFDHDGQAPYLNVEALRRTIVGRAHAKMPAILERHRRNLAGAVRNTDDLGDLVREAKGRDTGNLNAREMADAFWQVAEDLRLRFNAAGGKIGKIEGWFPQTHSSARVRAAGLEEWRPFVLGDVEGTTIPVFERSRMIDEATGKPFDDETLALVLGDVFETIRTEGWAGRAPSGAGGGKKLANRRADHRFLHFTPEGWLAYQARFGDGGEAAPFDAMMGHVEGMARDTAHMEILGPNPAATVRWLKDGLIKDAQVDADPAGGLIDKAKFGALRIQQLYDTTSGALNSPVSTKWARRFGTWRSLNVSQFLGGAVLSALTDTGFQAITRAFNGLPVTGALTGYLKLLTPANKANQRIAVRLGLIAEEASKMGTAQQRYLGESIGHEWARRLADGVLRVSGLSPWTQAGRWAFGMEFLGHLADNVEVRFDALSGPLRRALERYGLSADDWDIMRSAPLYEHKGASFMRPEDIAAMEGQWGPEKAGKLADRLLAMVLTETDYAVPVASVRARSLMSWGQPGTFAGEASRNAFLFKSFGVSMLLSHGRRMMSHKPFEAAVYGAGLSITLTMLGALVVQSKEIKRGRDPLPMADAPEWNEEKGRFEGGFWARAMFQGGGFGIFGDFAAAGTSGRTGSLAEAVAGPVVGTVGDAFRYGAGTMEEADVARRYIPGGSIWFLDLVKERLWIDELRSWTHPDYRDSQRRVERAAERQGQGMWWGPGEDAPERGPDFGTALEEAPE